MSDLIVLTADGQMLRAVKTILSRHQALGIRSIQFDAFQHPQNDPGCLLRCQDFLRPFLNQYDFSIVMLDHDGCGQEHRSRQELEADIEHRLRANGWQERSAAIVIQPELENWVWANSNLVDRELGWSGRTPNLRNWLQQEGFTLGNAPKPQDPKMAYEKALKIVRKPKSSSHFVYLANNLSLDDCVDAAFGKFKVILRNWFSN